MPPEELEKLLAELRAWCKAKHGRQKEIAEALQVSEDTVSHWIANRKTPGLAKYFEIRDFLKKQRRRK